MAAASHLTASVGSSYAVIVRPFSFFSVFSQYSFPLRYFSTTVRGGHRQNLSHLSSDPKKLEISDVTASSQVISPDNDGVNDETEAAKHKYMKDVFLAAPRLLGSQCKYSHISPHVQSRDLKYALNLLTEARCLHQVFHSGARGIPLESQVNPKKKFKLLFPDIGLMQRALGPDTRLMLEKDIMTINRGSVSEQFVGQQLMASVNCYEDKKLYFWAREKKSSSAEVDYLTALGSAVFPVEVKSGKTGTLKSLRLFLDEYPECPFEIRFSMHDLSLHDRILSISLKHGNGYVLFHGRSVNLQGLWLRRDCQF